MNLDLSVYRDQEDVEARLSQLGLNVDVLLTAAQKGLAAWADCTPNHPPTYPGTAFWAETIRALRDALCVRGKWNKENPNNLPLVVNADGSIALTVSSGDEYTGIAGETPSTRSSKGPRTADAVRVNRNQLNLPFGEDPSPVIRSFRTEGRQTWILLSHRDIKARMLRCELSRPISITEEGQVDDWAERLILPVILFGDDEMATLKGGGDGAGQSPEIVVEIKKLA